MNVSLRAAQGLSGFGTVEHDGLAPESCGTLCTLRIVSFLRTTIV
jgi:hypothetical protein